MLTALSKRNYTFLLIILSMLNEYFFWLKNLPVEPISSMMKIITHCIVHVTMSRRMYNIFIVCSCIGYHRCSPIKTLIRTYGLAWCYWRIIIWFNWWMLLLLLMMRPPGSHRSSRVNVYLFEKKNKKESQAMIDSEKCIRIIYALFSIWVGLFLPILPFSFRSLVCSFFY